MVLTFAARCDNIYNNKGAQMGLGVRAFIWAEAVGGRGAIPFGALRQGERFRFRSSDAVFVKNSGGWYADVLTGKKYRTNSRVAVLRIEQKGENNA